MTASLGYLLPLAVIAVLAFAVTAPATQRPVAAAAVIGIEGLTTGSADRARRLIVQFEPGVTGSQRSRARGAVGATLLDVTAVPGAQILELPADENAVVAAAELEQSRYVKYADPDRVVAHVQTVSTDPYFASYQWALKNTGQVVGGFAGTVGADIDAQSAWDIGTGAPLVIAVADTGVAYQHTDLKQNIWLNTGELGGGRETNGLDDDANGYIDDFRGWDAVNWDSDPRDDQGHGTHVAGTIGARGDNGTGVAGINWRAQIMPVKIGTAAGEIWSTDELAGLSYAVENGAKVVNGSYGGSLANPPVSALIQTHPEVLFVFAAGNGGDDGVGDDNDSVAEYPCNTPAANVICVAATHNEDALTSFSNFGVTTVDLGAPGEDIVSTFPESATSCGGSALTLSSGTSMAAPHVAGATSLLWGLHPSLSAAAVKSALMSSVDPLPTLATTTVSGGRLNLKAALDAVAANPINPAPVPAGTQPSTCGIPVPPSASPTSPVVPPGAEPSTTDITPPGLTILRTDRAKLGRKGIIELNVTCDEDCGVTVSGRARVPGFPALVRRKLLSAGEPAEINLKMRSKRLKQVKALLRRRSRVKMFCAVVATDGWGNRTVESFTINLSR